jgi:hypothetical protein
MINILRIILILEENVANTKRRKTVMIPSVGLELETSV